MFDLKRLRIHNFTSWPASTQMVVVLALAAGAFPALPAAAAQWQALPESAPAPGDMLE